MHFTPNGPWFSKKCDAANASLCSDLYHSQEQSPGYPYSSLEYCNHVDRIAYKICDKKKACLGAYQTYATCKLAEFQREPLSIRRLLEAPEAFFFGQGPAIPSLAKSRFSEARAASFGAMSSSVADQSLGPTDARRLCAARMYLERKRSHEFARVGVCD